MIYFRILFLYFCLFDILKLLDNLKFIFLLKSKEIKFGELPKKIEPEYITGYTKEERKKEIDNLIAILQKEKEETNNNLNKKLEEIKKKSKFIKKEEVERFKLQSKEILDKEKSRKERIEKEIQIIKNVAEDEYTPIPQYIMEIEDYQIEKENEDIPENVMRITVNNLTYTKSNPMVVLQLNINNNEITKQIKGKSNSDINETFDWTFNEKDFMSVPRNKLNIALARTYMIKKDKLKGISEINLKSLKEDDTIGGNFKIRMESGKPDNTINIEIKIRTPFVEKKYETISRKALRITKVFPKFSIEGDNYVPKQNIKESVNTILRDIEGKSKINKEPQKNVQNVLPVINEESRVNKIPEKKAPTKIDEQKLHLDQNKKIINNNNKNLNKNVPNKNNVNNNNEKKIDKNLFSEEELKDVDNIDYLNSLNVLKDRLKKIEEKIAKIDGRTPRDLLQKKIKINVKIKNFETQMNDGEIEPKDYLALMEQQLQHDVLLCKYLKQENEIEKAKLVFSRINLLNGEIAELKKYS